ncbi:hypothetical protein Q5752_004390 [Cryptotrichosporon argae]
MSTSLSRMARRTLSRASSTSSTSSTSSSPLSSDIKALLKLPAASPKPAPSPGTLGPLFQSLQASERHGLEPRVWLTLGTAAICTVNSPDSLVELYDYASRDKDVRGRAGVVEVMRETGLKCISFNGLIPDDQQPRRAASSPRTRRHRSSAQRYDPVSPSPDHGILADSSEVSAANIDNILARGRALWDDIYHPHHDKLLAKLGQSHPDLPVHILSSHYSPLLSNPPGQSPIGRVLTSVIAITCLRAQTGVGPQVTSHVYGLKKSLGGDGEGARGDKVVQGQEWLVSDEGVRWVLETTDEISAVIGQGRAFGGARS